MLLPGSGFHVPREKLRPVSVYNSLWEVATITITVTMNLRPSL